MQNKILSLLLFFPLFFITLGSDQAVVADDNIPLEETTQIIKILSSNKLNGRGTNTDGFDKASKFIEVYLLTNNVYPLIGKSYRDTLKYSNYNGYNLLARVGEFRYGRRTVVLGAHLDHIGKIKGVTYNGANDNATGCTALLQVAAQLAKVEQDENIIIAFFCGEEDGMWGSRDFTRKLAALGFPPDYMINFEMLGVPLSKGEKNQVYATGYEISDFAKKMNEAAGYEFVTFFEEEYKHNAFTRSDNISFYKEFKIPAHTLISYDFSNYVHYHKKTDDFKYIDTEFLNLITNISAKTIQKILDENTVFTLTEDHEKVYNKKSIEVHLKN